jgi:hypothetical protein
MMARTRFMPPPQIGVAEQTYWTFPDLNRGMGKIQQEWCESVLD